VELEVRPTEGTLEARVLRGWAERWAADTALWGGREEVGLLRMPAGLADGIGRHVTVDELPFVIQSLTAAASCLR